jgi:rod shape-determining protein MreC
LSLRDGPLGDIKVPLRWTAAVALIVAIFAVMALVFVDPRSSVGAGPLGVVRRVADQAVGPVGDVISAPIRWIGAGAAAVSGYFIAGEQNQTLRRELAQARKWRDTALALAQENARYRALMGVKTDPPIPMVFAQTVTDSRGPFANSRLADVGASKGVVEGNPALSEHGLVGRVTGVGANVCRIMLLSDPESRVPVMIASTNARAILTGDGGPNPSLAYLRTHEPVRAGERVMTSGDGGVFPRGLPVGVTAKGYDGQWRVILDADAAPIDYVQILLFKDFSQLEPAADLAPQNPPSAMTARPTPTLLRPTAAPSVATAAPPTPKVAHPASPAPVLAKHPATPATTSTPPKKPAKHSAATIGDLLDRP